MQKWIQDFEQGSNTRFAPTDRISLDAVVAKLCAALLVDDNHEQSSGRNLAIVQASENHCPAGLAPIISLATAG